MPCTATLAFTTAFNACLAENGEDPLALTAAQQATLGQLLATCAAQLPSVAPAAMARQIDSLGVCCQQGGQDPAWFSHPAYIALETWVCALFGPAY